LFTDSFDEANGVATVSQQFAQFARARQLPFACVRAGERTRTLCEGSVSHLELKRSHASFPLDKDLSCDPLLSRYKGRVVEQLGLFQPDLVHITGPGDFGVLGFWVAHCLRVALVASWHTNLHEYAARRLEKLLGFAPRGWRQGLAGAAERWSLGACTRFYRLARFTMAPNALMVDLLRAKTGRPSYLMAHGVDTERFTPARRTRAGGPFRIGYVGRLTPEKNVRALVELEKNLIASGARDFVVLAVGEGGEREWLRTHLRFGDLPGVLRGDQLADAVASMDAFVFPSQTDTFGLVMLEAMASGVPVISRPVTAAGVGITDGLNGLAAEDFTHSVLSLMGNEPMRRDIGSAARRFACSHAWGGVFERLYETYAAGLDGVGTSSPAATDAPSQSVAH
jgi:phosphatidylinositol alpha 1,6-mannosyltransferase